MSVLLASFCDLNVKPEFYRERKKPEIPHPPPSPPTQILAMCSFRHAARICTEIVTLHGRAVLAQYQLLSNLCIIVLPLPFGEI